MQKVAILGAGNGGHAASADLALRGYDVNLFELPRFKDNIESILERGGIEITGDAGEGFAKLNTVTTDVEEAVKGVDIVLIMVPAFGHKPFAEACIPHLEDGQAVILLGKGGGSLVFAKAMKDMGVNKDILLGEGNTLPYTARIQGPAKVKVSIAVHELFAAALPGKDNNELAEIIEELYPSTTILDNVLETTLHDINAVLHPPPMILNAGRIEDPNSKFLIYKEGVTPAIAKVYNELDAERLATMEALGLKKIPFADLYMRVGFGPKKDKLLDSINDCYGSGEIKAASNLQYRYITEDVPFGLVTLASLGDLAGVPCPTMKSLTKLASVMNEVDYWKEGRTVRELGIADLGIDELIRFVSEGLQP